MYSTLDDWLAIMANEYLGSFIPAGGSAVKFTIPTPPLSTQHVRGGLEALANTYRLLPLFVDATNCRIHFVEQLFAAVAKQIDWDSLAAVLMRRLLEADGFVLPAMGEQCDYGVIAALSGTTESEVRYRVRTLLTEHVARDYAMIQEFRLAMLRLCQAYLEPARSELPEVGAIHQWLYGELRLISALKPAGIFQKVTRHLARDMFFSLAHWLRLTEWKGMMLTLDIARYMLDRRHGEPDGLLFYSTSAVMDAYEVLRQFIDATDDMEGCLIVVIAPPAFLSDDTRGLARYAALKLRVWDEVRDRRLANPLAALIRLSDAVA